MTKARSPFRALCVFLVAFVSPPPPPPPPRASAFPACPRSPSVVFVPPFVLPLQPYTSAPTRVDRPPRLRSTLGAIPSRPFGPRYSRPPWDHRLILSVARPAEQPPARFFFHQSPTPSHLFSPRPVVWTKNCFFPIFSFSATSSCFNYFLY